MFICNKCLKRIKCKEQHFSGSYGPCEVCRKTTDCVNCPPYHSNVPEEVSDKWDRLLDL